MADRVDLSQHLAAWRLAQRLYGLIQAPMRVALSERGSDAVPYDKTAAAARLRERRRRSRVRSGRRAVLLQTPRECLTVTLVSDGSCIDDGVLCSVLV